MPLRWPPALCCSLLFGAVLACPLPTVAQTPDDGPTSVGFASPGNTQPIRDYRLPSWRWSQWTLDVDGQSSYQDRESTSRDTQLRVEESFSDVGVSLNPNYRSFWESEERRISLRASPSFSLSRDRSLRESDNDYESTTTNYQGTLWAAATLREYVGGRTFLLADGTGRWAYDHRHQVASEERSGTELSDTNLQSNLHLDVRLGVGVGRVRVVTPVVRALRVRERLRAVAPGTSLSDEQVQKAARQLARRPGYEAVYDRPDKVFWRDFFDRVGAADRSPFETFYVADVLRESVGLRREGAELQIGPSVSYDRQLERDSENDQLTDRTLATQTTIGGFVRGRWYRNVTLQHQLGADLSASYGYFVENEAPDRFNQIQPSVDHNVDLQAEGQWLWVLADRFRLDTRMSTSLNYRRNPLGEGAFRPENRYALSSNLVIFVENSLRLTTGGTLSYRYDGTRPFRTESNLFTSVQFELSYVLSRALQ